MNQDSALYLFFRPVWKSILHLLTGQTEIERVSRNGDVHDLDRSISLSKMLEEYKKNHCQWVEAYHPDFCEQLCAIKNIRGNDSKFRVGVMLEMLHSWKYAIGEVEKIRKTVYDSTNEHHEGMLMGVWERLRPGRTIKARKSTEWIELGFQAEDPATDFRGAGLLGLINLHSWVNTVEGRQTFKVADNQGTDYFFASASMFMTMLGVQLLRQLYIPAQYWVLRRGETVLLLFQQLFQSIWIQFGLFWNMVRDKSMMQFNQNLLQFGRQVRELRIRDIVGQLNLKKVEKMG